MDPSREIVATEGLRPLSRAEYDRLIEIGIFGEDPVELLHGVVVPRSPQGPRHAATVARLHRLLVLGVGERAEVRAHSPFAATPDSEPEPDLAVVPPGDWDARHPERAHLVVEVCESSQRRDRGPKRAIYAAAGVPEYWIVDVAAGTVEVCTDPAGDGYRTQRTATRDDTLRPAAFPDLALPLAEFLPRAST